MATHHQKLVGLNTRTDGEGDFFGMNDDVKTICSSNENYFPVLVKNSRWGKLLLQSSNLNNDSEIRYVKRIKISGRICYVGSVFLRFWPILDQSVTFFRISDILVSDGRFFFVMEDLETCYLCEDRFGFVVIHRKTFIAIESCSV